MRNMFISIVTLILLFSVGYSETPATGDQTPENDVLYSRSIKDIEILAILEFEGLKIAVFRDKKTGLIHPLQVGNYLTNGKISSIDTSGVRVAREGKPDYRYSVNQRIVMKKTNEYVSITQKDMDLRGILANLAKPAEKTVYVDGGIKHNVSLSVKDIHWRDLMNILVETFNLKLEEDQTSIHILNSDTEQKFSKNDQ
ncbi:MAG: hypothetical protein A2161_16765 [Candidatus Schekmanbacteria bacterium RBG_13_48_7]|uniref:Secretin/TonB short N-terminal domain-containing protein n=1 Tax=Candidatus Schekmanbacteria bacterium RBG_13_48_7 TaxID=1817878 RepID=A0A1F7RXC8_9BACT|nr:MAG: hypothetical protein A2161_16765 [Candidatus Schekmanbacteria bacterium RBG_13_48_7]